MSDPFFIDECLSLALVAEANSRGHIATHVTFRGLAGAKDWDLLPMLIEQNFILVTNNGEEFKQRYANLEIHPGLVIIVPGGLVKEKQVELFDRALDVIEEQDDIVNKVIEVDGAGNVTISDLPEAKNACSVCGVIPCACGGIGGASAPRKKIPGV